MWIVDTASICLKQGVTNIYLYHNQTGVRMVDPVFICLKQVWDGCEDSQINGKKYSSNMSEENKYNINMFEETTSK